MRRTLILALSGISACIAVCVAVHSDANASHNSMIRHCVVLEEQSDSTPSSLRDRVSLSVRSGFAIVTVRHRRGIGHAVLRLKRNPKGMRRRPTIRLRFKNFKGLEALKAMNGERTISLHDEDSSPQGQHLDLKRKGEGFDVEIPPAFLVRADKKWCLDNTLRIEWVDFYR